MSAKATAVFEGDDSKLAQTFKHIDHQLKETQEQFEKLHGIGETVLAGLAAEAIFEKIKQGLEGVRGALEVGEKFDILSKNTGVAVSDLVILAQAFRSAGKDGEDVGAVLAKMQKAIVTGSANEVLEKMGVNLEELRKATPREQFESIGKAINSIHNPAERAAAAIAIFGKTGASLLALFEGDGLEKAGEHVGNQARILGEDAALFREVAEELNLAGTKVQGFFVGVADEVAPVLKPLLEEFAAMDFSQVGQQVGSAVAILYTAFSDGKFGTLVGTSLEISLGEALNAFSRRFLETPTEFGVLLWKAINTGIELMLKGLALAADKIPGGGVLGDGLRGTAAEFGRASSAVTFGGADAFVSKFAPQIDLTKLQEHLGEVLDEAMSSASAERAKALKEVPTIPGRNGDLSDLSDGKFTANVSALTRVGGNFGGGAGDPLLAENRRQTSLLQRIADALSKAPAPTAGGDGEGMVYA